MSATLPAPAGMPADTGQGRRQGPAPADAAGTEKPTGPGTLPAARPGGASPAAGSRRITPIERVAVILSLLEPEQARDLAERLDPGAVEKIIDAYERMRTVPRPILLETIATFVAEVRARTPLVRGGGRAAEALSAALGAGLGGGMGDAANDMGMEFVPQPMGALGPGGGLGEAGGWDAIKAMEPAALSRLVAGQRPVVVAALLGHLPAGKAGALLAALPEETAIAVVAHMAKGRSVSEDTFDTIVETLQALADEGADTASSEETADAFPKLTAILNRCPLSRQTSVLEPLRETASEHADAIEQGLIRFPSLHTALPPSIIPSVFREIDETTLHAALRYGGENAPDAVDHLYANISQRLAEQIRQAVNAKAMPDRTAGEEAQAAVIGILLEWADQDRFAFLDTGGQAEG